jgi:hypothetical protein
MVNFCSSIGTIGSAGGQNPLKDNLKKLTNVSFQGFPQDPSGFMASVLMKFAGDPRIVQTAREPLLGNTFHVALATP